MINAAALTELLGNKPSESSEGTFAVSDCQGDVNTLRASGFARRRPKWRGHLAGEFGPKDEMSAGCKCCSRVVNTLATSVSPLFDHPWPCVRVHTLLWHRRDSSSAFQSCSIKADQYPLKRPIVLLTPSGIPPFLPSPPLPSLSHSPWCHFPPPPPSWACFEWEISSIGERRGERKVEKEPQV